ncbi:hypothetical protein KI387_015582, partial [Taxus chinensis]
NHSYEECLDLYEHLSKKHKQENKGAGMVRIQRTMENQWMPKLELESEALQVRITTHAEVAHAKEALQQKPTITKEEVLHARYPDPSHQKEVYQETME